MGDKACRICGEKIPSTKKSGNVKYCSSKCAREAEKQKAMPRIAKKAAAIAGINHMVYRAYGRKCAICGWQATTELIMVNGKYQHAHGNEIHHIIPVSKGGEEVDGNLILLCPNHHKLAHLELLDASFLQKHAKRFTETPEEVFLRQMQERVACAEAIANAIFKEE